MLDNVVQSLLAHGDGDIAGTREFSKRLDMHPRLVQALFRWMKAEGLVRQIGSDTQGPLYVAPAEASPHRRLGTP